MERESGPALELEVLQLRSHEPGWTGIPARRGDLAQGEELWLVTDHVEIAKQPRPHVLVITNQRLLVLGPPPDLPIQIALPARELKLDYENLTEIRLAQTVAGRRRPERYLTLRFTAGPHAATNAAIKGLIAGVRPVIAPAAVARRSHAYALPDTVFLGGHGCAVARGCEGTLFVERETVHFFSDSPQPTSWSVPIAALTLIDFGGPGAWQRGGRMIGGGFGVLGAAEGMLIASAINRLTVRKGVLTVIRLEAGAAMSTWWQHTVHPPEQLRIDLSWLVSDVNNRERGQIEPSAGSDAVGGLAAQLTQLAALHDRGILSDEEFAAAKARVLA